DMQDTFYLERPAKGTLPDLELVKKIKSTHEKGWKTGSTGWGYQWKEEEAQRLVLRTHTTASTVRALAENPNPPRKVFCVGRVFRNETISYKHLPEFHQVDGIIIDKDASFATLLGTLREFYRKMGFQEVKFKPAFFPYTEPSAEVFVWMEQKKAWIELGGSGIFRPEVTEPLGCKYPVLAWGLGLERLAMLRYNLSDIRELYWSKVDWLKEVPLCQ
ncbi:MAG: phenylalanine--tRNA ligase subunit alpha, partial [Planctomycetota bacterium]